MFDTQKIADTYDQIALNFSATRPKLSAEAISLLPNLAPGASVLDLGCGNGVLLMALPNRFGTCKKSGSEPVNYTGLDISRTLLAEAKKLHPQDKFLLADIAADSTWTDLPQFDFIAVLAVLHHLPTPDHHIKLLRNIKQHLKPNGTCLISVWRLDQPKFDQYRTDTNHLSIPFHQGANRNFYSFTDNELPTLAGKVGFSGAETKIVKDNLFLTLS